MRTDENGNMKTLEQDIIETWKRHGLEVLEEEYNDYTWLIKAKKIEQENKEKNEN